MVNLNSFLDFHWALEPRHIVKHIRHQMIVSAKSRYIYHIHNLMDIFRRILETLKVWLWWSFCRKVGRNDYHFLYTARIADMMNTAVDETEIDTI